MAAKNNLLSAGGNVRPDRQTEWTLSCSKNTQNHHNQYLFEPTFSFQYDERERERFIQCNESICCLAAWDFKLCCKAGPGYLWSNMIRW